MSKIQLLLLGHFDCLLSSGERIVLSMRKAEVLLAYLALAPGIRHPRERLINLLWSDRSEEQARNSLRQCLSAIKKSLGDSADLILHVDRTTVSLKPALIDVDALEFERLATEGDFESLSTATSLYSGEFLEGISIRDAACQEWLDSQRSRFRRQFIEILTNLGETQVVTHDFGNAIKTTERLVVQDPLGESGWRLLMRSYHGHGDRSHALMAFKRCSEVLQKELGVEPEAETRELQQQIKTGKPEIDKPAHDIVGKPVEIPQESVAETKAQENSIAVLPFDNLSGDPEQEYFSDGITESLIVNLSSFSGLAVKSRHTSFAYKNSDRSIEEIAVALEVQYMVEGSIRKFGDRVRITVQLSETESGNQLWGKRFESDLDKLFSIEEELVQTIAGTISGRIGREVKSAAILKPANSLKSYDYLMRAWHHMEKFNPTDNKISIEQLAKCIEIDPGNADAHSLLAVSQINSLYGNWTEDREQTLSNINKHMIRALELEPNNALTHAFVVEYYLQKGDLKQALFHADRSIELNPTLPEPYAIKAYIMGVSREPAEAIKYADIAMKIDPYHYYMGWSSGEAYLHAGEYQRAIDAARTVPHMPANLQAQVAGCLAALGQMNEAKVEMKQYLRRSREDMANYPPSLDAWKKLWHQDTPFLHDEDFEAFFELLLQAGLCDEPGEESAEIPSVLVLPFENMSGDPEQEYFSDGISESIIQNLSSFSGLKVKSRHTSFAFKDSPLSIGEIAKELDVQFVVEGSVRKRGEQIRTTVQLADTDSGNQIWGKRLDTPMEELLALEEELVQTIAGAISGRIDRELRSTSAQKTASSMKSYDYLMRGWYHAERFNPEDYRLSIQYLKKCVELDPENALAHTALTAVINVLLYENWTTDREATRRDADYHINRALEIDRCDALAHAFMSEHLVLQHNHKKAMYHAEQAIEHNPALPDGYSTKAFLLSAAREHEEAVKLAEFSLQIDPFHFYLAWNAGIVYRNAGLYLKSADAFRALAYPSPCIYAELAASLVGLGDIDEAIEEMGKFRKLAREQMLEYPSTVETWRDFWHDISGYQYDEDFDDFFNLLLQAGLCDDLEETSDTMPSILVLPLENMSGDPEQDYFSNGITESIILSLSSSPNLNVKSRHTSFAYQSSKQSVSEIGAELEVPYIVEGSIRKNRDQVRITVQLSESSSGNQIWGKRYDRPLDELFDLEEELVHCIAGAIGGRIGQEIKIIASKKSARDMKSFDYLMRGMYYYEQHNPVALAKAIENHKKCIELDPENAEAHANIAGIYEDLLYENWCEDREQAISEIEHYIQKALALDQNNAMTHAIMGEFVNFTGDYETSLYHASRAIELDPTLPDGYLVKAIAQVAKGDIAEAVELADYSMQLDPFHNYAGWSAGEVYRAAGNYKKAIEAFHTIPNMPSNIRAQIAASLVGLGQLDKAREEMVEYLRDAHEFMPEVPGSKDAWHSIWNEHLYYHSDKDFDIFFDQLLQAGLCEGIKETIDSMPSILVLPFENMSGDPEQVYFSDGITTSIILGLGMYKDLSVKSRQSSFAFRDSDKPSEEIAGDLAVDYLVEGSIRKSGKRVRVSVHLIDAESGSQAWGRQYNEQLDDIFELEQELSRTIAATISGRIGNTIQQSAVRKSAKNLKSYDYFLRGLYHLGKLTARDMEIAKQQFESCLKIDPENAMAHTNLGNVHIVEIIENWSSDWQESNRLAGFHFETALELEPENAIAHAYLAEHLFYTGDYERSEFHADKAIELNPTMSEGYAVKADLLGFTRRVDEAVQYADKCIQLDPHSVGAGWVAAAIYRKAGLYQKAIKTFRSINHPPASVHALISVCFANMELHEESEREMQRYLELAKQQMPVLPRNEDDWRQLWRNNLPYQYDEDFDEFFELLVKAGLLKMAEETVYEAPSIAVLPFENMSGDPEQEHFADGITTDIIATLSRFKHMRTMSRFSILKYKTEKTSIDEIATEQGVRYILEGSVRRSGERIRVSAELIDSRTHDVVWSERYDRNLDDLFAVQDEIAKSIAVALKVHLDDGDMAMHRSTGTSNIKAWQLVLAAVDLQDTYIQKNILEARSMAVEATRLDPEYPYAWVCLGWTYWQEIYAGWGSDSMGKLLAEAKHACQKAFDILPDYSEAWTLWGLIHLMKHEAEEALEACRRAVDLEPGNAEVQALMAFAYLFVDEFEQARKHNQNMLKLCPVLPNWYYLIEGETHRLEGNPSESIQIFRKGIDVEPESPLCRFYLVDALMQIGDITNAQKIADEIRALDDSANGKGLVQTFSSNEAIRESFRANLARFDLV